MGRTQRDTAAGIFHVYTHCVWSSPTLFRDDIDRMNWLRHLARVTATVGWTCMAYCALTSHHHLLVEVGDGVLPIGMHRLNLAHARDFNRRHGLRGHVQFQRYGSSRIRTEEQLLDRFAYIALNPVRAGLCARPEDWPWSSYRLTVDPAAEPSFVDASRVLACFADELDPRAALRRYVERQLTAT
jgi:REP element-mobilizing transposase RayT